MINLLLDIINLLDNWRQRLIAREFHNKCKNAGSDYMHFQASSLNRFNLMNLTTGHLYELNAALKFMKEVGSGSKFMGVLEDMIEPILFKGRS